jgi:hypothetical protein
MNPINLNHLSQVMPRVCGASSTPFVSDRAKAGLLTWFGDYWIVRIRGR